MSGYCRNCGAQLVEGARFCSRCRTPVGAVAPAQPQQQPKAQGLCSACGAPLVAGARFCSRCRTPVGNAAPAQPQQPKAQGLCSACGAPLVAGARFCSRCRNPVGNNAPAQPATPARTMPQPMQNLSQLRQNIQGAVPGLSRITEAAAQPGEIALNIDSPFGLGAKAAETVKKASKLPAIIGGLAAGGISCAALWNNEHALPIDLSISGALLALSIVIRIVRRKPNAAK